MIRLKLAINRLHEQWQQKYTQEARNREFFVKIDGCMTLAKASTSSQSLVGSKALFAMQPFLYNNRIKAKWADRRRSAFFANSIGFSRGLAFPGKKVAITVHGAGFRIVTKHLIVRKSITVDVM